MICSSVYLLRRVISSPPSFLPEDSNYTWTKLWGWGQYHLVPSMIMVTAQFDFTDAISNSLNRILAEERNEGNVIFGGREGHIPPERVKAKKVSEFLLDLQRLLEEFM